jgi:transcriptional regulator with XRE-family HTH domain
MPADVGAEVLQRWGAAICNRRKAQGLSQVQLAEATGVDQRTISSYEKGKFQPPVDKALAIAKALDTTHDSLFSVDEVVA